GRADQRLRLRRTPRDDDAARLPGVQLDVRRLRGRDDGVGNDGGSGRRRRPRAARSDGDAPLLRLSHGGLLPALDQDAALAARDAEELPRELVPQGRRRALSLARLRTEPARAEVDRRPGARPRADTGVAARLDAALRGLRLAGARLPARAV